MPLAVTPTLVLDDRLLTERFIRASGPGGQNVNKVATAVELRFDLGAAPLDDQTKQRLRALAGHRLVVDDDVVVIDAREHRLQSKNRESARARLLTLLRQSLVVPRRRRKTRPTAAAKARRIDSKVHRSRIKTGRVKKVDAE